MNNKVKTPFRYPGGKFYALKYLLPYINAVPHDEYREPFVGGGSVFFGKNESKYNWINDIEEELINTYKVIQEEHQHKELIKLLEKETATKERHNELKDLKPKNNLERAFKYYYLNRTSYSGIMHKPAWGYRTDKSSPPKNWGAMIIKVHHKLANTKITNLDFEEVILAKPKGSSVLLYLDPPYVEADQKRAYKNHFLLRDHERLCRVLKKTKYYFILSYDNIPFVKELYKWAHIVELSWLYNTSNLNGNKNGHKRKMGKELIISNWAFEKQLKFI